MDRTLVAAARSGDEEAFGVHRPRLGRPLFAVAPRILHDVERAEDAVQQTLVTAWRELPGLREVDRFDAWLHRLLVHACYAEVTSGTPTGTPTSGNLPLDGPRRSG